MCGVVQYYPSRGKGGREDWSLLPNPQIKDAVNSVEEQREGKGRRAS